MTYTRIDIIGGKECCVSFETLHEALSEEPPPGLEELSMVRCRDMALATFRFGAWWPTSACTTSEFQDVVSLKANRLRTRLAETLGLTDPSDDELVEAVRSEQISKVTLCAQLAAVLGFPMAEHNPPDSDLVDAAERAYRAPTLTDAPLPEGREGESIVVVHEGDAHISPWDEARGSWALWHGRLYFGMSAGDTGHQWAYVKRMSPLNVPEIS